MSENVLDTLKKIINKYVLIAVCRCRHCTYHKGMCCFVALASCDWQYSFLCNENLRAICLQNLYTQHLIPTGWIFGSPIVWWRYWTLVKTMVLEPHCSHLSRLHSLLTVDAVELVSLNIIFLKCQLYCIALWRRLQRGVLQSSQHNAWHLASRLYLLIINCYKTSSRPLISFTELKNNFICFHFLGPTKKFK